MGALVLLFGMDALARDFHLPLPIYSQDLCTYVAYYFILLVLLFGVGALLLIFGMSAPVLLYYRFFCILFFVLVALIFHGHTDALIW